MSVLTHHFNTKYNTAPFSKIKNEDFLPAFQKGIELAKAEIDAIVRNPIKPTFENTIEALDYSGEVLDRISSIFFNLNSVFLFVRKLLLLSQTNQDLSEYHCQIRTIMAKLPERFFAFRHWFLPNSG